MTMVRRVVLSLGGCVLLASLTAMGYIRFVYRTVRSFVRSFSLRAIFNTREQEIYIYIYRRDRKGNVKKDVSVKYVSDWKVRCSGWKILFYSVGERISYNTGVEIKLRLERVGKSMCAYITTRLDRIRINGKRSM